MRGWGKRGTLRLWVVVENERLLCFRGEWVRCISCVFLGMFLNVYIWMCVLLKSRWILCLHLGMGVKFSFNGFKRFISELKQRYGKVAADMGCAIYYLIWQHALSLALFVICCCAEFQLVVSNKLTLGNFYTISVNTGQ